ncbi:MAG: cdaR [Firmicutes bacterium]|nr:cdaR [Bacillota bacterium]
MNYFLGRNLLPKLLAVLVALIVWVFVMNEQNPPVEGTFQVTLSSRNLSEKMVVMEAPETVKIKLRGLRNAIAGAAVKEFRATVDLKGMSTGQYNLPVNVVLPRGYELLEVLPDKVTIRIEALRSRHFTVEPRLSGPIASQMVLGKVEVRPAVTTVTGPQSLIDSIDKVLAPLDIKEQAASFSLTSKLVLLGPDGNELKSLTVEPSQVNVSGNLESGSVNKTVDVKPVLIGNLPDGILLRKVFTEPVKIGLSGPKEIIDKLDSITTVPISLTGITKEVTKEVPLQLPAGVTAVRKTVVVRISVGQGP